MTVVTSEIFILNYFRIREHSPACGCLQGTVSFQYGEEWDKRQRKYGDFFVYLFFSTWIHEAFEGCVACFLEDVDYSHYINGFKRLDRSQADALKGCKLFF